MNVVEQIKKDEGFSEKPYRCTSGKLTIGYGFNLDAGMKERYASWLLMQEIQESELDLINLFGRLTWDTFNEVRQNAFINMRYQLGPGGFRTFEKMIDAARRHHWGIVQSEALESKWAEVDSPSRAQRIAFELGDGISFE